MRKGSECDQSKSLEYGYHSVSVTDRYNRSARGRDAVEVHRWLRCRATVVLIAW